MITRTLPAVLVVVLAAALLPHASVHGGETAETPPTPALLPPDSEQLAKLKADFEKAESEKDAELLKACLAVVAGESTEEGVASVALVHADFAPFVKRALKSKDETVEAMAILAAASLELKDEVAGIRKLLKVKAKKKGAGPSALVQACALDFCDRMGLEGDEKVVFEDLLLPLMLDEGRMTLDSTKRMYRAAIRYLGRTKYKPSVKWLITQLDRPEPANVNAGNNPPASYWKARTELWQAGEGWVRWALKEITGEEFRRAKEWELWYDENKKAYEK